MRTWTRVLLASALLAGGCSSDSTEPEQTQSPPAEDRSPDDQDTADEIAAEGDAGDETEAIVDPTAQFIDTPTGAFFSTDVIHEAADTRLGLIGDDGFGFEVPHGTFTKIGPDTTIGVYLEIRHDDRTLIQCDEVVCQYIPDVTTFAVAAEGPGLGILSEPGADPTVFGVTELPDPTVSPDVNPLAGLRQAIGLPIEYRRKPVEHFGFGLAVYDADGVEVERGGVTFEDFEALATNFGQSTDTPPDTSTPPEDW